METFDRDRDRKSNGAAGWPSPAPPRQVLHRLSCRLSVSLCERLVSTHQLPAKGQEQARGDEAAGVPRRDAQLLSDLTKREPKPAKAMHRRQAEEATVSFGMHVELINECKLAMPPRSGFWKDAFDKRPRPLHLLLRELLRSRPTPPWSGVGRKVLSVHVVSPVRPSNRPQPSRTDVDSQRLDMAPEAAGSFIQLHQRQSRQFANPARFKVSGTCLNGDCIDVNRHAPRWRALPSAPMRPGVRLGPRYPRDSLVLNIATPRIAPMSDEQFARAVEVLAEMLGDQKREGDSPSTESVIRRVRV